MPTVLVVEDEAATRRPLARLLRNEGYTVATAINAYEAMAGIRTLHPDLILLDVGIPPMDGLTCLMLMHQENPALQIPVILVTGYSDENTIARGQEMNVKAHLVKSRFTVEELMDLVRKYAGPAQAGTS
ncbi:MAG TPA: response regulator [Tepidisphaeraceae bacterium]|nr:response regulator [Tepidisphaeraceae bacterium]